MSQHDFNLANQTGILFRADLNAAMEALVTQSSGTAAPATTFPFQAWVDTSGTDPILKFRNSANTGWIEIGPINQVAFGLNAFAYATAAPASPRAFQPWVDTSGASPILKIRNAGNTAWIIVGPLDVDNFGLLPLAGGTLTGALLCSNVDHIKLPVGTTAERTGTPTNGMVRYNTTLKTYEGYREGAWGPLGGGQLKPYTDQTNLADTGTISISTLDSRQLIAVSAQASSTQVTLANAPFGNISALDGPFEVVLYNPNADRVVTLSYSDANDGCIGNFDSIDIYPGFPVKCILIPTTRRILVQRGV